MYKVLENNTMCICIYMYINHMFAYSSIEECCFIVVQHEYYGLLSWVGHVASILDIVSSYGASPQKRIGVIDIEIDMFVNYSWVTPSDSNTVQIYMQTVHRITQLTSLVWRLSGIRTQIDQTKINHELIT